MYRLDHVNIRTADPERLAEWYGRVLGLERGWRPPFDFPGAWLYAGDHPVIHLVGVAETPGAAADAVRIEHFALSGDDLAGFRARLAEAGIEGRERPVPGTDILQFHLRDPDGNHLHIDFRTGGGG